MRYTIHKLIAARAAEGKWCYLCGKPFQRGEQVDIVIFDTETKQAYPKLSKNIMAHANEFNCLEQQFQANQIAVILALVARGAARKQMVLTPKKNELKEAIIIAAQEHLLHKSSETSTSITFAYHRSSLRIRYEPFTDRIRATCRGNLSLFEKVEMQNLSTRVWNRAHEIVGDGLHYDELRPELIAEMHKMSGNTST